MILYHEVSADAVASAQKYGLKCDTSGQKTDALINETDKILDNNRPSNLKNAGVSRQHSLYAFMGTDESIIDIKTGAWVNLKSYQQTCKGKIVRIVAPASACYVSDLDCFDTIKSHIKNGQPPPRHLLANYWQAIVPLNNYVNGSIKRPEVMIAQDVPPANITLL